MICTAFAIIFQVKEVINTNSCENILTTIRCLANDAITKIIHLALIAIVVDDLWFCYDHKTMQWTFSKTEIGTYYEAFARVGISEIKHRFRNFNVLPITIEFGCVLMLDVITIIYLHAARSEVNSRQCLRAKGLRSHPTIMNNFLHERTREQSQSLFRQSKVISRAIELWKSDCSSR